VAEPLRVLIVEDSEDDTLLLLRELRRGGYSPTYRRVDTAPRMESALDEEEWDIVVSDHSMPAFSAPAALKILQRRGLDLPFIILSGRIGEDVAVAAMKAGAHDYIVKGNLARLVPAVERELREAEMRRDRRRADEELRRSEERYRSFIAQSSEGIWRAELEKPMPPDLSEEEQMEWVYQHFVLAECNETMARMYGYDSPEELVGARFADLIPREPGNVEYLRHAIRSGYRVTDAESHELDRYGNSKYFLNNFVGTFEDGHLIRVWGTQRDITERKQAEEALLQSEERYRAVVTQTANGIFLFDADSRRIVETNAAFQKMLGYSTEELIGMPIYDFVVDTPESVDWNIRLTLDYGQHFVGERAYRRKDGKIVYVEVSGHVISQGGRQVLCAVARDITERKQSEEALRESEERYRTVVEQATECIYLADLDSRRIVETNAAFQKMLGYSAEELQQMTIYDFVAHEPQSVDEYTRRIQKNRRYNIGERRYRCRDGSLVDVEVSASLISYRGRELLCVVAHDITERKRAEERLKHNLEVLLALYDAGHILSSPLKTEEIGAELLGIMQRVSSLTTAAIQLREDSGRFQVWETVGPEHVRRRANRTTASRLAFHAAIEQREIQEFRLPADETLPPAGLCLPLRVQDRVVGVMEAYGPESLLEHDTIEILSSLTSQAGSALENARLYRELAEHEAQLKELVGKLLVAQEEERHRVAYDVHDGLAQMIAASYQNLQAFVLQYSPEAPEARQELQNMLEMLRSTVREARRIIVDLRPTTLDDFGLAVSVRQHVEALRAEGWEIDYRENLGETRLPVGIETALFRIVQEALSNVRKHADTRRVRVVLQRRRGDIHLEVTDRGRGFSPERLSANPLAPGEQIGLSGMRERAALLGGEFELHSRPGSGTTVSVRIPESRVAESGVPGGR
jgi:PAS domain S-box-containing protein